MEGGGKKTKQNRAHPFLRAGVYLNKQAHSWNGTEPSGDGEVHAECKRACVTAERTSARAGNIICPSESSRRAGPVVIRPETTNTTAVFVRARKRDKRRSVMDRQTETLPCHLSWHRAQTPGWCCCAAYSLWLHFQICNWWDLGQYWGNTAARKFKGVTLRVSQTKWAHREKKPSTQFWHRMWVTSFCFPPSLHPDALPVQPPCSSLCPHARSSHPVLLAGCQRRWKLSVNRRRWKEMLSMCSPHVPLNVPRRELRCAMKTHKAGRDVGRSEAALVAGTQEASENKTLSLMDPAVLFTTVRPFKSPSASPRLQSAVESNWHVFMVLNK